MGCRFDGSKRRAVPGYMTVEAAMILSTVFFVYLFLIRSFFGIYDRCVLEQDMAAFALRCTNAEEQELERVWQQEIGDWNTEKYLWLELKEPMLQKQGWRFTVTGSGESGALGDCGVTYKMWHFSPEDWLRMSRRFAKEEKEGESEK